MRHRSLTPHSLAHCRTAPTPAATSSPKRRGIKEDDLVRLKEEGISKFNIGTDLRKAFGESLRSLMSEYPNEYDRLFFLEKTIPYIKEAALRYLKLLG